MSGRLRRLCRSVVLPVGPQPVGSYWMRRVTTLVLLCLVVAVGSLATRDQESTTGVAGSGPEEVSSTAALSSNPVSTSIATDQQSTTSARPEDSTVPTTSAPATTQSIPTSAPPTTVAPSTASTDPPGDSTTTESPSSSTSIPIADFEDLLKHFDCAPGRGESELAAELLNLKGADGSGRLVQIVEACPLRFTNQSVPALGRRLSEWEVMMDHPIANVTENPAQRSRLLQAVDDAYADEFGTQ